MKLDILSPKGIETREQEKAAIAIFHDRFPDYLYLETRKDSPSVADAMIYQRDPKIRDRATTLRAIAETKCRQMTLAQFIEYESRWLITNDKLKACRYIAKSLRIPLVGLLYLVPDKLLLVQRIYNEDGTAATDIRTAVSKTQRTVNGGSAVRENAYVLVKHSAIPKQKTTNAAWLLEYETELSRLNSRQP